MADWYNNNGRSIVVHDPIRTAFLIIVLLEKERIPRCCVDETFKIVKDILNFQEIIHTERNERHPSFPK